MIAAGFLGVVLFGGSNFVAVRYSNAELDPLWGAGLRFALAATLFIVLVVLMRLQLPRGRDLAWTAVFGLLNFGLFYALMYWSLNRVTAGVATVILATVPLSTLFLAALQGQEHIPRRGVLGGLTVVVGVGWMALGSREVHLPLAALAAMLGASLCSGQSIVIGKRLSGTHPAAVNAIGMAIGALVLLAASVVGREGWGLPHETDTLLALGYLVTLGSVGLFFLVLVVVSRWTASATSYAFVLFPLVAMVLDALLLDDPITLQALLGTATVITGVWVGVLSGRSSLQTTATAAPTEP